MIGDLVRCPKSRFSVIPADPGSGPGQAPESRDTTDFWTPAFAGVTTWKIFSGLIMMVAVKIRGIYATALTRFFLDQGVNVVSPSDPIIRRFGKAKGLVLVGSHDVEITDSDDKEGIRIEGESESVDVVTTALRDHLNYDDSS